MQFLPVHFEENVYIHGICDCIMPCFMHCEFFHASFGRNSVVILSAAPNLYVKYNLYTFDKTAYLC